MGDIFRRLGWIILIKGWDKIIVHILSRWAIRDKDWKKAPFGHICPSTFPQSVACLLWQHFIWCGDCPGTPQSVRSSFSSLSRCDLGCFLLAPRKHKTSQISTLFPVSLALTASIHFIYSCRPPESSGCLLNRGRSCSREQDAVRYETLCFLFIGCHDSFRFGL